MEEFTTRADAGAARGLEHVDRAADVDRASNAGSATARRTSIWAAEVEDHVGRGGRDQRGDALGVAQVGLVQHGAARERALEVGGAAGGEVVEHLDAVAARDQRVDEVGSDEPGAAGHEGLHEARHARPPAPMRIWVDFTNTAHVIVLRPLVERLEAAGHEVALTARPLSHTVELLEDWGRPHSVVGRHGGVRRRDKALAAGRPRARACCGWARGQRFDRALAHGSTDVPVVSRLLRIPNTHDVRLRVGRAPSTTSTAGWRTACSCRTRSRPSGSPATAPAASKLIRYPGPEGGVLPLGLRARPRRARAARRRGRGGPQRRPHRAVLRALPRRLARRRCWRACCAARAADPRVHTVVLARTDQQRADVRALGLERVVVPERTVDGRSLVALADVLVSAGGTMNREAAVLGTPVWSMFEGPLGGVDEQLVREGRLQLLEPTRTRSPSSPSPRARSRDRVRRDPGDCWSSRCPGRPVAA